MPKRKHELSVYDQRTIQKHQTERIHKGQSKESLGKLRVGMFIEYLATGTCSLVNCQNEERFLRRTRKGYSDLLTVSWKDISWIGVLDKKISLSNLQR